MRRLLILMLFTLFGLACISFGVLASMHPIPDPPDPSPCACGEICAYNYRCGLESCPHTLKGGVDPGISNPGNSCEEILRIMCHYGFTSPRLMPVGAVYRTVLFITLLLYFAMPMCAQDNGLAPDWKQAIKRVPLHFALSLPVVPAAAIIPPIGKAYVHWRARAEANHVVQHKDTPQKAEIDLYSQTVLVRKVLKLYRIKS